MSFETGGTSASVGSQDRRRGVLYLKWGPIDAVLQRSIASVRSIHPELPIHVQQLPDTSTLLDKAEMMNFTPFEETLFLDADTVVLDRLDFGFDMAVRHGLACAICECPWARRYGGIKGELVEYNTGVLFFTHTSRPIFEAWSAAARVLDSSIRYYGHQNKLSVAPCNDQASFAWAIANAARLPFILPQNWNFRARWQLAWCGPIKIWHDYNDPPAELLRFSKAQSQHDSIIQFARMP